jgi:phage shock protein PspC (stress-responsive transcriptional regulator)
MEGQKLYENPPACPPPKQAYRTEKERVIAGVAGGMGEYFRIDPDIFRIILVILGLFFGLGVIVYLIFWIFLPPKSKMGSSAKNFIPQNIKEIQGEIKSASARLLPQPPQQKPPEEPPPKEIKGEGTTIKIECPSSQPSPPPSPTPSPSPVNYLKIIISIIVIFIGLIVVVISGLGVFDFFGLGPIILLVIAFIILIILIG